MVDSDVAGNIKDTIVNSPESSMASKEEERTLGRERHPKFMWPIVGFQERKEKQIWISFQIQRYEFCLQCIYWSLCAWTAHYRPRQALVAGLVSCHVYPRAPNDRFQSRDEWLPDWPTEYACSFCPPFATQVEIMYSCATLLLYKIERTKR